MRFSHVIILFIAMWAGLAYYRYHALASLFLGADDSAGNTYSYSSGSDFSGSGSGQGGIGNVGGVGQVGGSGGSNNASFWLGNNNGNSGKGRPKH